MRFRLAFVLLAALVAARLGQAGTAQPDAESALAPAISDPVAVIFDTDMWSDIDDALALAMLHALADRGEIELLAVTISTNDPWCSTYVNLLNTFYGRPAIPIGIVSEGMDLEAFRTKYPGAAWPITTYTRQVSTRTREDGSPLYPRNVDIDSKVTDAVTVLRRALATQADHGVVVIQVGFNTNLARLLRSESDEISSLTGRELVAKKVKRLVAMAGVFGDVVLPFGKTQPKGSPEFNLTVDAASAQKVFANWPTPVVVSGFEVGMALTYSAKAIERDYSYSQDHPIAESLRSFCRDRSTRSWSCAISHGTPDLTAVLYAARADRNYFSLSAPGKVTILDDGSARFEEAPTGQHRYLTVSQTQIDRTLEAMLMLATQPPVRSSNHK